MTGTTIPLRELAHARSGDKGNRANIGVICKDHAVFPWLEQHLTCDAVARHFLALKPTSVSRYLLPNLAGFNFVLEGALAGGASQSLRWDSQGKALASALLELDIPAPPGWLERSTNPPHTIVGHGP